MMNLGKNCIALDTGLPGLVVGALQILGEATRLLVRFLSGKEEWFAAEDIEFL